MRRNHLFSHGAEVIQQVRGVLFDPLVQKEMVGQAPDHMGEAIFQRARELGYSLHRFALIGHEHHQTVFSARSCLPTAPRHVFDDIPEQVPRAAAGVLKLGTRRK